MIHVPRTGGTSLGHALFGRRVDHERASFYDGREGFRFAFVRNPYDRFRSAFQWLTQNAKAWADEYVGGLGINDWLAQRPEARERENLFLPMVYWLDRPMDFVGRYERLDEDVKHVQRACGLPPVPVPRLNTSIAGEALTPDSMRTIRRIYADDFARFAY